MIKQLNRFCIGNRCRHHSAGILQWPAKGKHKNRRRTSRTKCSEDHNRASGCGTGIWIYTEIHGNGKHSCLRFRYKHALCFLTQSLYRQLDRQWFEYIWGKNNSSFTERNYFRCLCLGLCRCLYCLETLFYYFSSGFYSIIFEVFWRMNIKEISLITL